MNSTDVVNSSTGVVSSKLDVTPLKEKTEEVANQIIAEDDTDKVKDLTHLFNLLQAKKNVLRVMQLDGLLDHVSEAMLTRFEKRPDEFSNSDLISYMNTLQTAIEKSSKSVNMVDESPAIVVNNTQVNLGDTQDTLSRESREKVADFIKKVIENSQKSEDIIITEGEDVN